MDAQRPYRCFQGFSRRRDAVGSQLCSYIRTSTGLCSPGQSSISISMGCSSNYGVSVMAFGLQSAVSGMNGRTRNEEVGLGVGPRMVVND
jgi:hypothetical protein